MRKRNRNNAGLTLMEMMISTALLGIFSIFIVNLVMVTQKTLTIEHAMMPIRTEAKKVLEVMAKELREGDPSAPGGVTIGAGSITFNVPDEVSQLGIQSWRQVQFAHDSDEQYITRTSGGTTAVIGRNISSLAFAQANNIITATVEASKDTSEGATLQTTLSSQVRLRN